MRGWRIGLALVLLLAACADPSAPAPDPAAEPGAWFVEVVGEGGYWLGPDALRDMALDPSAESPPALRLSWAEREVPHLPRRTDEGWGIFFFAPDRATRYSHRTALRLEAGMPGEAMTPEEPPDALPEPLGGLTSLHWERDERYLPQADTRTPWFWEPLRAPGAVTHTLVLTDALPGPITTTLHLWSHTASPAEPDHLLRLRWDGRLVGEWTWDGQGMKHLTAAFSLEAGEEHALSIEAPSLPDAEVAMVWLDGWDVTYRRRVRTGGSIWRAEGSGLRVEGARPGARAFDMTDPFGPRDLGAVPADGLVATTPSHRYWIGVPEEASGPLAVRPAREVDHEALGGVSYLALAPSEFHGALRPLLTHRQEQGLTAAVVTPRAVYDDFGDGRPHPGAIQALVRDLPSLRYLLLVGDGTAEPAGYDGEDGALRVVAPFTRTAVLGETPADGLLGTDREGQPVVAVGRFPATSADEVDAMVEKSIRWEGQEGAPDVLLLSDDEAEFRSVVDEIAPLLPDGASMERLDAGDEGSREEVLKALRDGPAWLNYVGHGSLTVLCDEGLLRLEDGEAWRDPALIVAWTCLAAHYVHPLQDAMAEVWLRVPRGGAVAFLGPVGETTTSEQDPFARAFYRALGQSERVGDAWLAALREGRSQDVARGYVLLGDPALCLPHASGCAWTTFPEAEAGSR